MTQVSKDKARPSTPRQAGRRKGKIDTLLDPELFRALSDPTRVRLLACMIKCGRGCTVTEVAECCDVDFSVVSRHLALLASAGVLDSDKAGRSVTYTVRATQVAAKLRALAESMERSCSGEACDGCC